MASTMPEPDTGPMTADPAPRSWRARVWWGDELVTETDAAIIVEHPGGPPALHVPRRDIRFEAFRREGDPGPDGAERWASGHDDAVLRRVDDELVVVDHDRLRVEIVDGRPGDDPRDLTTTRFPVWGDAAHLIDLLDVRPAGPNRSTSTARADWRRPVVEGSQMLGQVIVAASRECGGRRPVSAHLVLTRVADANLPLDIELDPVANGRTFSTFVAYVSQRGRRCASGTVLLDETAPDLIRHHEPAPDVPGPYDCTPYDMAMTGRDLRIVDDAYTGDPDAPVGPPVLDAWVRIRDVPDDPAIHAGLVAQFTGHLSIAAALRPHAGIGQDQAHRTLSSAINAIAISFHTAPRADRWLLYRHRSTFAGDGMSHAECRVHDEDGDLVASFTVDAMIRGFTDPTAPVDDRSSL